MTTKNELFKSLIAEFNGKFNGVRRELKSTEIPPEIIEIMKKKNQTNKKK